MIASPKTREVESKPELETTAPESNLGVEFKRPDQAAQDAVDETLYLIGRPKLKRFLRFVRSHAVNPPGDGTLTDEWQAANSVVRTLEKEEAGLADNPAIGKLGPEYEPLLIEFLKDPLVQNGFNTVPTEVAMVELDRLVVYQHHIDLTFVRELKSRLGPAPSDEQIFRTCLPYDHPQPPVKWSRVHRNGFVFMSPSNDLRFLGTMKMESNHIKDYPPPGNLVGVVGLAVGFGSNFMNALYAENRLILNNGSHRAYALREMGFTHVPCIVQHVSSRDQLDVVAASEVEDNPDYFLKHPRPSMLIDYFNPRLRKVMPVHRQLKQITVKFEVDEAYVPAL
jgi:plasmid stabilization system protein ParE